MSTTFKQLPLGSRFKFEHKDSQPKIKVTKIHFTREYPANGVKERVRNQNVPVREEGNG